MTRVAICLLLLAMSAGQDRPPLQVPANFTGWWRIKDSSEAQFGWFGASFVATQSKTALILDETRVRVMDDYPGSPATMTMSEPYRRTIKIGAETRQTFPAKFKYGKPLFEDYPDLGSALGEVIAEVERANFSGDQLVIVNHMTYHYVSRPGGTPPEWESELTTLDTLTLDHDELVVERLWVHDPDPIAIPRREPPSVEKQAYIRCVKAGC